MGYTYLAQGYTHENKQTEFDRYSLAIEAVALLHKGKWHPFSPIVQCYTASINCGLPGNFEYWQSYNTTMMAGAARLMILDGTGWQKSKGCTFEREWWRRHRPDSPPILMTILEEGFSTQVLVDG